MAQAESQAERPADEAVSLNTIESPDDLLDLPSGEGYRVGDADEITRRSLTNVVLFAGTAESGKTTLLASLSLLFQKGTFAGYAFAGSRTLMGFEKRVHDARLASMRKQPKTERTKFSELLHLRVRKEDRSAPSKDMLLCDLWGEDFREARDSIDGCKRLTIIRRADAFVLLIDGDKLSKFDARQQAKNDPIALLRNVLDCDMLAETAVVDVVQTKWDKVQNSENQTEVISFADHVNEEIDRHFSKRVANLNFWRVAAHATDASLPLGYGLEELFPRWVERPTGMARHRVRLSPEPSGASEYDRYMGRHMSRSGNQAQVK